jgi:hypothetical protein
MYFSFLQQKKTLKLREAFVLIFIFFSVLFPFSVLKAAINKQINYQGKLTTSAGVAVANGTYNMEFILYDDPTLSGVHILWTETRTGVDKVQVTNGLFSVMLGEVTSLAGVDFNQTLYLGVNIGGTGTPGWDGEMTPRKKLGAVPSAVVAEGALNIIGGAAGTIPYQSAADTTAFSAVGVAGQALISGNTGSPTWFAPTLGSILFAGTSGALSQDNANFFWDDTNKRLGIGTVTPADKLEIASGNIMLSGGANDRPYIHTNGTFAPRLIFDNNAGDISITRNDVPTRNYVTLGLLGGVKAGVFAQSTGMFGWTSSGTDSSSQSAVDTSFTRLSAAVVGIGNGTSGDASGTLHVPVINGSTVANGTITIQGTTNATRTTSYVNLQPTDGNVGIGTATPGAKLQVVGGSIKLDGSAQNLVFSDSNTSIGHSSGALRLQGGTGFSFGNNSAQTYATISNTGIFTSFIPATSSKKIIIDPNTSSIYRGTDTPDAASAALTVHAGNQTSTDRGGGDLTLAGGTGTGNAAGGNIIFQTAPAGTSGTTPGVLAEIVRITSTGLVGIGNTSPAELLTLGTAGTTAGTLSLAGATSGKAIIVVNAIAGNPTLTLPTSTGTLALVSDLTTGYIPYTGGTSNVDLGVHNLTVDTNSLFVDSVNHEVGIGTVTPGATLDVNGNIKVSASTAGLPGSGASIYSSNQAYGFAFNGGTEPAVIRNNAWHTIFNSTGININPSTFNYQVAGNKVLGRTGSAASLGTADQLIALDSGNVGVGTTAPDTKLHISGDFDGSSVTGTTNSNKGLTITKRTGVGSDWGVGDLYGITFAASSNDANDYQVAGIMAEPASVFNTIAGNLYLLTKTNNSGDVLEKRVTITSTGNTGIGTTSPTANLQVAQGTAGVGTVSNGAGGTTVTGVGTQFLNTFKIGDTITINGETVAISAIASNTSMTTAAITGANSGVAYTLAGGTRFSVLGNGNVGIGTTTPGSKLTILNGETISTDVAKISSAFNIGANSILNLTYTGADGGRSLSINDSSFNTGGLLITKSTGASASNTNVSGLLINSTFTHSDAGGAGSIGNGAKITATNNTASAGTLYGLDLSATANTAGATAVGLRVTAASSAGTPYAAIFSGGNVGIGTTGPTGKLEVSGSYTTVGTTGYGIKNTQNLAFATNPTTPQYGLYSALSTNSATVSYGNANALIGTMSEVQYQGAAGGTAENAVAIRGKVNVNNGGTLNTASALHAQVVASSGTINTGYGLYVDDITATTDYGIYQAGTNDVNYFAGNLGIASTSPSELLTLGTAGTTAGTLSLAGATSGKAIIVVNAIASNPTLTLPTSTGTLALVSDLTTGYIPYTGGTSNVDLGVHNLTVDTNSLFVDATNHRVGVGTLTPTAKLELSGSSASMIEQLRLDNTNGTGGGNEIRFQQGGSYVGSIRNYYNGSSWNMRLGTFSALDTLVLMQSGNVGIGTASPTANLQVAQSTAGVGTVSNGAGGTTVTGVGTQFLNTFKIGDTITINGETVAISAIASNTSMTTAAITGANSGVAYTLAGGTRFSVLGNGNVGIGTTSPSYLLHVNAPTGDASILVQSVLNTANLRASGAKVGGNPASLVQLTDTTNSQTWNIENGRDASGNLGFYNSGTKMVIDSTGNVGIGTTSPGELLSLGTTGTKGVLSLSGNTNGKIIIQPAAAAGTYTLTLPTDDGTPSQFLQTDGSGNLTWATGSGGGATTALDNLASVAINTDLIGAVAGGLGIRGGTAANDDLILEGTTNATRTTSYVNLQPNGGNVGIGTATPASKLEINGGTDAITLRTVGTATGLNWSGRIVAGGPSNAFLMGQFNDQAWLGAHNAALNAWAPFYINPDGTQDLYIGDSDGVTSTNAPIVTVRNSNGRVGIGTTTPDSILHVNATSAGTGAHVGQAFMGTWSGGVNLAAFSHYGLSQNDTGYALLQDGTGQTFLNSQTGQPINFRIGNTDKVIIDSAGKVGIGTTGPGYPLEVAGLANTTSARFTGTNTGANWAGRIIAGGASNVFLLGQYNDQAWLGAHNAALSGWADLYINPDGGSKTYIGDSGGGAVAPVPLFTVDNGTANVGIGTTSPLLKLDVAGSGRFTGSATSVLTGSIDPAASTTVTGVGTAFTTQLVVGDRITVTGETRTVTAIASDTSLTVDTAFSNNANDTAPDKLAAIFIARDSSNAVKTVINDLGNVGIGTTGPGAKLDVVGNIRLDSGNYIYRNIQSNEPADSLVATTYAAVQLQPTSGNKDSVFRFLPSGTGAASVFEIYNNSDVGATHRGIVKVNASAMQIGGDGGTIPIDFIQTNASKLRIATDGKVGIGTTSPGELLSLGLAGTTKGVLSFSGNTSGKIIIQPAAAAGTYTLTLPTDDGTPSQFLQTDGSGNLTWATGSSGANTALSNLASVAINTSLLPGSDDSIDLGDNTHRWRDLYLGPDTLHIGTSTTDEGYLSYTTSTNVLNMQSTGNISLQPTAGNVGINQASPAAKLNVTDTFPGAFNGPLSFLVNDVTSATNHMFGVDRAGYVEFNQVANAGSSQLCYDGTSPNSTFKASYFLSACSSSIRYKTNVQPLTVEKDKVFALQPVTFDWKKNGKPDVGMIAEEVQKQIPALVFYMNGQIEGVNYDKLPIYLLEIAKEQDQVLATLNLSIADINSNIDDLDARIATLEANANTGSDISSLGQLAVDFFTAGVEGMVDGIAYMKGIVVGSLKVGSPDMRTGITLYDEVTGSPNCFSISNGAVKTTLGECAVITPPTDVASSTYSPTDMNAPIITLDGDTLISMDVGSTYVEPGAFAKDADGNDLAVIISGSVDTSIPGTYTITYSATNGTTTSVTRTVAVVDNTTTTPTTEPAPEPAPTVEPVVEPAPEPAPEAAPVVEPAPEPAPEPTV